MSINVHMKEEERRNRLKIWKQIKINIQILPTDTVAQWAEHRRDKPRTRVQILACVIFFIFSVFYFYPSFMPSECGVLWVLWEGVILSSVSSVRYNKLQKVQQKTLKQFMIEAKNLICNLHGTCAMFLRNTLPDQQKPAVYHGIYKLPEIVKTVMECRSIIDENLSDQTAIDIAIEHIILPPFRPIISGIGCLTDNI